MSLRPAYSTASDMYAFGIILYELCCRRIPFAEADSDELSHGIRRGERDDIPAYVSPWLRELIQALWHPDASQRPTALDVVRRINPTWR